MDNYYCYYEQFTKFYKEFGNKYLRVSIPISILFILFVLFKGEYVTKGLFLVVFVILGACGIVPMCKLLIRYPNLDFLVGDKISCIKKLSYVWSLMIPVIVVCIATALLTNLL